LIAKDHFAADDVLLPTEASLPGFIGEHGGSSRFRRIAGVEQPAPCGLDS
jgi:hypothetical protein